MPEYEASRLIEASPQDVYVFVSDVRNLATYLPTVQAATPLPRGRVRIEGRSPGGVYADDGFLKFDEDRRRMEWRADERNYQGWLEVSDEDGLSRVRVHLTFGPEKIPPADPIVPDEVVRDDKPVRGRDIDDDSISLSLGAALDALHDLIEGRGGKREVAD